MSGESGNGAETVAERLTHHDHPDSPMRKKPRLNEDEQAEIATKNGASSQDAAHLATPSDSTTHDLDAAKLPSTPERRTQQTTPCTPLSNKVTLNLKFSHSESPPASPIDAPPEPLSEAPHDPRNSVTPRAETSSESEERQRSPGDPLVLSVNSNSESPESPVIEIAADDDDGDGGDVVHIYGMPSIEDTLIDQFPVFGNHVGVNAAKMLAQSLDRVDLRPARIEAITKWLKDWIALVGSNRAKAHNGYTAYEVLWNSITAIVSKLVRRRELRGHQLPRDDTWGLNVTDFLRQYLIICAHHFRMDLDVLNVLDDAWSPQTRILSSRVLNVLPGLLDMDNQATMAEISPFDTSAPDHQIRERSLVVSLLHGTPTAYRDLTSLMVLLLHNLATWPDAVRDPLRDGLTTIVRVGEFFLPPWPFSHAPHNSLTDIYLKPTIQVMHALNSAFPKHIAKQPAGFSADWNREIVNYSSRITHSVLKLDRNLVHGLSDEFIWPSAEEEAPSLAMRAEMIANKLQYKLAWKLAAKGRLEIRILGVNVLQELLIALYQEYRSDPPMDFMLQQMSTILLEDKVLDHLLSKDSHPEVLLRSGLIMAFLHLTNRYPPHLTDTIFDILTSASDARLTNALSTSIANTASHMHITELLDFCRRIGNLSSDHLASHLIQPLQQLTSALSSKDLARLSVDDVLVFPFMCLSLAEKAFDPRDFSLFSDDLRKAVMQRLTDFSARLKEAHRKCLYDECVHHAKARDSRSVGSLRVLIALLSGVAQDDVKVPIRELSLLEFCVDELSWFLEDEGSNNCSWPQLRIGLSARLELFTLVLTYSSHDLGSQTDKALLELLVGSTSLNVEARSYAWDVLTDLTIKLTATCPFLERCINGFFANLNPDFYTSNICTFLQAATDYCVRTRMDGVSNDHMMFEVPLTDLLWRVMVCTEDTVISQSAVNILCARFLDPTILKRVPLTLLEKAHVDLVRRSLAELQESAVLLRQSTSASGSMAESICRNDLMSAERKFPGQIAFVNITHFLKQFFVEVRQWPVFRTNSSTENEVRAKMENDKRTGVDMVQFTFQSFDRGRAVRSTLDIPKLCTYAGLHDKIRLATGFGQFEMILGGQKLNLLETPEVLATSALQGRGNVLIRNSGGRVSSLNLPSEVAQQSLAEKEVFCHFDDLFHLLDLEDRWSVSVLQILELFPPHPKINSLISKSESHLDLFPPGRRVKASYSLFSMKNYLHTELQNGRPDRTFLHCSIKTLSSAILSSEMGNSLNELKSIGLNGEYSSDRIQGSPIYATHTGNCLHLWSEMLECLAVFLQETASSDDQGRYFDEPNALVERISLIFDKFRISESATMIDKLLYLAYRVLFQASLHDARIWSSFTRSGSFEDIHSWLLLKHQSSLLRQNIQGIIQGAMLDSTICTASQRQYFASDYWPTVTSLINQSAQYPERSEQLLTTALAVFRAHIGFGAQESEIRKCFTTWTALLLKASSMYPRHVLGLALLVQKCVDTLKSKVEPAESATLAQDIFARFLFPNFSTIKESLAFPTRFEATISDPRNGNSRPLAKENDEASLESSQSFAMIMDDESRLALYELILHLCGNIELLSNLIDITAFTILAIRPSEFENQWNIDRSTWMRSKAGYLGLRNLSNTCYINSLIAQLYMTETFRDFILGLPCPNAKDSTGLLCQTQHLFKYMEESTGRFADTQEFVASIKPYDGEHIDISIQMDVDEFYNLLFERWEGQMPSKLAKTQLRKHFGGQLVTQVKSMECQHISERLEPFLAIQCEVKGQHSLTNSLKTYVEGDVMNGDNKYKCEACGGKFVNAVKRSCLKDLPDHLTFHLKRFDFDVQFLQRTKINDRFEFPEQLDMAPYRVENLNGKVNAVKEDVFILTGILIHTGTAEVGHYYSLIRLRGPGVTNAPRWAEFNDKDVSLFDHKDIPLQAFGGVRVEDPVSGVKQDRFWNAYMLFYQRASSLKNHDQEGGLGNAPRGATTVSRTIEGLDSKQILDENQQRALRYCLFDPSASRFVRALAVKLKDLQGNTCSDDHQIERQIYGMLLPFTERVLSRSKEQDGYFEALQGILKFTSKCTTCSAFIVDWMFSPENRNFCHNLLIRCPVAAVRRIFKDFLFSLLAMMKAREPKLYGHPGEDRTLAEGFFSAVVDFLEFSLLDIGRWAPHWDTFFEFIHKLTELGREEIRYLISRGTFAKVLQLLMLEYSPEAKKLNSSSLMHMRNSARDRYPYNELIRLLPSFLAELNIFGVPADDESDRLDLGGRTVTDKLPITVGERYHLEFWAGEPRQLRLITKIFEAWDSSLESHTVPVKVIENIMRADPSNDMVTKLARTIRNSLLLYYPSFVSGFLQAAVSFCRLSEDCGASLEVIEAVCKSAADLEGPKRRRDVPLFFKLWDIAVDNDCHLPQAGCEHLSALVQLSNCREDKSEVDSYQHLGCIIEMVPAWAPSLLLYDGDESPLVRSGTNKALQALIFRHYPQFSIDTERADEMSVLRSRVVNDLFFACTERINEAMDATLPRSAYDEMYQVCRQCELWVQRLQQDQGPAFEHLLSQIDSGLCARWLAVSKLLNALPDQDDMQYEDSDMYEESFDTEDDEIGSAPIVLS